jgi:hypothetical protein
MVMPRPKSTDEKDKQNDVVGEDRSEEGLKPSFKILEEKVDACLDAIKELTKAIADMRKDAEIKRKAGNF